MNSGDIRPEQQPEPTYSANEPLIPTAETTLRPVSPAVERSGELPESIIRPPHTRSATPIVSERVPEGGVTKTGMVEQAVHGLGRGVSQEAVVVGSSAVGLAIPDFPTSANVDVVVSNNAFAYLQQQPGWTQGADGRLVRNGISVEAGQAQDVRDRSWQTESGVWVAGLPDVYAQKQRRANPSDIQETTRIRTHLQDHGSLPFSARVIPHEVAAAKSCLPEELQEDPAARSAILLAANGLHMVYTLYGHPDIGRTNQIVGDLEHADYQVPATYHNGFGLIDDARALQQHMTNIGASDHDRLLVLATDPFTDAVYGNGRFRNNPQGYDELRSADLLRARALQLGFTDVDATRMHAMALSTAFDEATGSQRGKRAADPLARAVVGVDLQPLSEPDSVERTVDIAVEDGCSARYSSARTLGRVFVENGERIESTQHALELIDRYADAKPISAPGGPTVIQAFAARLAANATFHRNHEYPADWTLDNPNLRRTHANKIDEIAAKLLAREITAVEVGVLAVQHTAFCS